MQLVVTLPFAPTNCPFTFLAGVTQQVSDRPPSGGIAQLRGSPLVGQVLCKRPAGAGSEFLVYNLFQEVILDRVALSAQIA